MANKWIINNGLVKVSASVDFHSEMAQDHATTLGGGYWIIDENRKIMYFFGASSDFGQVTKEQFDSAWNPYKGEYTIVFSDKIHFNQVMAEYEPQRIF